MTEGMLSGMSWQAPHSVQLQMVSDLCLHRTAELLSRYWLLHVPGSALMSVAQGKQHKEPLLSYFLSQAVEWEEGR